jgi:hypothetical protein
LRALSAVVILAACRPSTPAAPFTLRIAVAGPLEPVKASPGLRSWTVLAQRLVFEPLITIGTSGELVPALAERVQPSGANGLRIWLRAGARFSDGSPVTMADVVQSIAGSGLQVTDGGDGLLIHSTEAGIPIELVLSQVFIFRHSGDHVLGTHAFRVEEQDPSHILLTRLAPAPGLIDRVRLDSYPTPQDTFAHTLKGDADLLADVQQRWVEFFQGVPRLRLLRAPSNYANMVAFNPKRFSRSERLALARALATDEIRVLAFGNECAPPTRRPGFEPLPPGRALDVLTAPLVERFGFAVRRSLGPRGGSVRTLELQVYGAALRAGDFDLATIRPRVWPPIIATANWRTGTVDNVFGYSNPVVDAALDRHDWGAAQQALDEDPPAAVVCTPPSVVVLDSRIRTPPFGEGNFLQTLPRWEVAQ